MAVLNVTPDSFSDGNKYFTPDSAIERALQMESEGADIIDIGGESSRPGAEPVDSDEEQARVLPVIEAIRKKSDIPISIDSYHAATVESALDAGADIVNDISALRSDSRMAEVVASKKVPVTLMHMKGTPRDMQQDPHYDNCLAEILEFFVERIEFAQDCGIAKSKIIIDPGIGFGKRLSDNLEIMAGLQRFKSFSLPLLVGLSRKSFIEMLNPVAGGPTSRIGGSIAGAVTSVLNGADIVRVHDIAETVEALKVLQAIRESS